MCNKGTWSWMQEKKLVPLNDTQIQNVRHETTTAWLPSLSTPSRGTSVVTGPFGYWSALGYWRPFGSIQRFPRTWHACRTVHPRRRRWQWLLWVKSQSSRLNRGVVLWFLPSSRLLYDEWLISDFRTADSFMLTLYSIASWWPSPFLYKYLLSDDASLCICTSSLWLYLSFLMYISTLLCASGTPSEFSSVPILVADKLVPFLYLCTTILGEYPTTETPKSWMIALRSRLSDMCDDYA